MIVSDQTPIIECLEMKLSKNGILPAVFTKTFRLPDEKEIKPASFCSMMRYATLSDWVLLITGLLCCAANGGVSVGILIMFGRLVDVIIVGQSQYENGGLDSEGFKTEMLNCCWIYYAAATVILSFGFPGVACIHLVSERQVHRIKHKFLYQVLNQDISWLDKNDVGKLIQQMTVGVDRIQNGTGKTIALIVQATVGLCCGVLIAFIVNWRVSVVTLIFLPLLILSIYGSGKVVKIMLRKETKAYEQAGSVAEEVLSGIRTVASFNAQEFELDRYGSHLNAGYKSGVKRAVWTAFFAAFYNLVIFGSMAVIFWYGSNLALDGYCSAGTVQGIFWLFAIGAIRVGQVAPHLSSVTSAKLAAGELFYIIDRVPEMDCSSASGLKPVDVKGQLSFQDLHFNYPSRPDTKVLDGISFNVEAGQKIALVGHSGCGKSTIISLLMRFYQPEKGQITLDGRSIDDLNVEWLRNSIGIVSQEPVIFAGSIEENLRMGKEDLTQEEMENACQMANAEEFIKKLPNGYKTLIGDGNIRLSGGQKQRLAIARALVRNPKILLLDEATSALDNESEQIVQAAIDKASTGRTTIIIAHRLRTIRNAHNIIVFDHGQIVECGSHEELMGLQDGVYKQLVIAQEIEKAIQMEDAALSDVDDISCLQQPISSNHGSLSQSKKIRRTLEYTSMYSARSSLGAIQFELELPENNVDNDASEKELKQLKPASILQIFRFARPEKWLILCGLLLALSRGISWPFYTVLLGKLFSSMANKDADHEQLAHENMTTGLLFGGLAIYAALLTFISGSMLGYTGEKLTSRLRLNIFRNLLSQDASFYDKQQNAVGKLTARLASDAPNVQAALDQRLADVLQSFTSFTIGVGAGLYLDWRMAIVECAVISFILGIQLIILQCLKRRTIQDAQIEEEAARIATESIQNVKTVQALNRQRYLHQKFIDASLIPQKRSIQRGMLQAMTIALSTCTEEWNFGLVYFAASYLISYDYVSPLVAFQVVSVVNAGVVMSFLPAAAFVPEFLRARMSAALMFKMIDAPTKINNMSDQGLKPEFHGDIEIKHAYFSYPNQKQLVLKDFSVKAYRGQTLALVGPSGCGKSTTIQLLERYYEALSGSIRIDDHDIRDLNIRHLRQNMALVGQEPTLFNLTIEQNIGYGMKSVSEARIIKAAKDASIHDFIDKLPQKYKTMVGAKAAQLSGGQRQRISIARAIIRDPKILLLDEATSSLDTQSEKLVQESLERASHGRTSIIIAHRLSTIQHADVIAVVKDGRVLEHGSHQQLLNRKGLYYRLVQKHNN